MSESISIIIPMLNEVGNIPRLLEYLGRSVDNTRVKEIIVVDGGSTDGSIDQVLRFKEVILVHSLNGRAKQMNCGARHATGDVLYFLHADTFPPKKFAQQILKQTTLNKSGSYRLCFDHPNHFFLRLAPWLTRFHLQLFRGGDQSLFIKKNVFEELGGFNEAYIIYEDVEFIERLYKHQQFVVLPDCVITSARKFERIGVWQLYYYFLIIHLKYWIGTPPEGLYAYYSKHIGAKIKEERTTPSTAQIDHA